MNIGESKVKYDYIIIGAGLAGITMANLLANKDKKVLVVEKRDHIGGNCYDFKYEGVLVHIYGPHIFHTDNEKVWEYLNQFAAFNDYKHRVKVCIDDKLVDLPINLNSLKDLGLEKGYETIKYIYEKVFKNYSKKQWGKYVSELDPSVFGRIAVRDNHNSDYFLDKFQGLPVDGYTKMFENMLFHENIEIQLKTDFFNFGEDPNIIYTGMIDELFDCCYGKLPYRSLDIYFQNHKIPFYQKHPVINYPNKKALTRITEYKYMTMQNSINTVISKEYPCEYDSEKNLPYYPIPTNDTAELYNKYKQLADKIPNLYLIGRLAEYKYYDMDDVIEKAIKLSEELC
jgi:UDP-galactopyranose mutase